MDINHRYIETPQVRKMDNDSRVVEFVASDNSVDSYGTVLPVNGWDLERYSRNGVVGYQHELYGDALTGSDPDDVIGKGEAFVEDDKLVIRVTFEPADLNPKADKIYRKIQFGSIKGVSVGFTPLGEGHWGERKAGEDPEVYYFAGQELLEVSVVNIPSNKNAVKRSIAEEREALPERPVEAPSEPEPEVPAEEPAPVVEQAEAVDTVDDSIYKLTLAKAQATLATKL